MVKTNFTIHSYPNYGTTLPQIYQSKSTFIQKRGVNLIVNSPCSLSYYTSLILLNVADHEDTTYHLENSIVAQS